MSTAQKVVLSFLANRISLEELEDWSASYLASAYRTADAEAQSFARQIRSILNAYEDDEVEDGMRQELANAVRPFAGSIEWSDPQSAGIPPPKKSFSAAPGLVIRDASRVSSGSSSRLHQVSYQVA